MAGNADVSLQEEDMVDLDLADDPFHDYVVRVFAAHQTVQVTTENVTYLAGTLSA